MFAGFRRYSDYSGYSYDFKYKELSSKAHQNYNIMVGIDAYNFAYTKNHGIIELKYDNIER